MTFEQKFSLRIERQVAAWVKHREEEMAQAEAPRNEPVRMEVASQ